MPVQRLNHAVLYVRDARTAAEFYEDVLGFKRLVDTPGAVFMQAPGSTNDHDLGLFSVGDGAPLPQGRAIGLYHLAWEVDTLAELRRIEGVLHAKGALVGASDHATTKALYAKDVDGIEFEVSWLVPAALIDEDTVKAKMSIRPLDLASEVERYGAETLGGVGISR